ncbi:MAG: TatD family hydrolase [Porticoccaceae bacterium]
MKLIDIGVNLTNKRFDGDRAEVLARARDVGVAACIVTGTSLAVSAEAAILCNTLSQHFPGMLYCTAGVHPHEASTFTDTTCAQLRTLIAENAGTVVAVGETGLDFNRDFSPRDAQVRAFEAQLQLAQDCGLPLFLHERDAHTTQHEILKSAGSALPRGVIHCFTGSREALFNYLDLDFYIGITGWICDERRGRELQELVRHIPRDRLLIETDAPYLLPRTLRPKPANGRNEPAFLPEVAAVVAQCRTEPIADIVQASTDNARALFKLEIYN